MNDVIWGSVAVATALLIGVIGFLADRIIGRVDRLERRIACLERRVGR